MRVAIVGAGGFGREVLQWIEDVNRANARFAVVGFLDDAEDKHGAEVAGLPVLGPVEWLADHLDVGVFVAVGGPAVKRRLAERCAGLGAQFPTLVHPSAVVGRGVDLGVGCIVCPSVILSCDIRLGRLVTINLAATIGHDAQIGDYVTVAPGVHLSGFARIGVGSEIGSGVSVVPNTEIGRWSVVGAGAVVAANLPDNCTAVGVPAKPIKRRVPEWHLR